jgi:hypothetical protein
LYRVIPEDGTLQACEFTPESDLDVSQFHAKGKYYQGGNFHILHKLLGVSSGSSVLYVGDHIYADILRSKRTLGWRTCLVVPELSHEMQMLRKFKLTRQELMDLRREQYLMESELDSLYVALYRIRKGLLPIDHQTQETTTEGEGEGEGEDKAETDVEEVEKKIQELIDFKIKELDKLRTTIRGQLKDFNDLFHPRWGQVS